MSISCNNKIRCTSAERATIEGLEAHLKDAYPDYLTTDAGIESDEQNGRFVIDFDAIYNYGFPAVIMQIATDAMKLDETLTISVLTYDQAHEYIAHHTYVNSRWKLNYESYRHPLCEQLNNQ